MQTFPPIRPYLDALRADHAERPRAPRRAGPLRRWIAAVARRWQRRKMIATLVAMDDRLLRDIGIDRADIPRFVDGLSDRELRMTPLAPSATTAVGNDAPCGKPA